MKKRFSEEKILLVLREVEQSQAPIAETCRKHGISDKTYYRWRNLYQGLKERDVKRLRRLERENTQLKKLLIERELELDAVKELLQKK